MTKSATTSKKMDRACRKEKHQLERLEFSVSERLMATLVLKKDPFSSYMKVMWEVNPQPVLPAA